MTQILRFEEQNTDWEGKKELLKRTICKGSDDNELELFIHACKRTGLDPFMKQIYAVKRWSAADKREVMTMQTSVDGFRVIAERTGRYAPGAEAKYHYNDKGELVSATSYVKKMTLDGTWHEIAATAFFDEYAQRKKEGGLTQFWEKMPHVMLAKCAECLALRKAFPAELSGIYSFEEMAQASKVSQSQEAMDIEHAQAIEISQKSEEDLIDELYEKTKNVEKRELMPVYLDFCLSKTKSSKREFLEGATKDPQRFVNAYEHWLVKNGE